MFSLGIILFEIFCNFSTEMERSKVLSSLRSQGRMPEILTDQPDVIGVIESLISSKPENRPSAEVVLKNKLFKHISRKRSLLMEENAQLKREIQELKAKIAHLEKTLSEVL